MTDPAEHLTPTKTKNLSKYFEILVSNYDALTTIKLNSFFAKDVIESLSEKNVNRMRRCSNEVVYAIIRTRGKLHDISFDITIDTGVNFSVKNKDFVIKNNIPINFSLKEHTNLANNMVVPTEEICEDISVDIGEEIFHCNAVVLENIA